MTDKVRDLVFDKMLELRINYKPTRMDFTDKERIEITKAGGFIKVYNELNVMDERLYNQLVDIGRMRIFNIKKGRKIN